MKQLVLILALVLVVAIAAPARGASGREVSLKGHVIDMHCASGEGDRLAAKARAMPKSCPLSGPCLRTGLGVVADGRWYAFDSEGSARAAKVLEKSKARKGVLVEVTGTVDGDEIRVSSIAEVEAEK